MEKTNITHISLLLIMYALNTFIFYFSIKAYKEE